MSTVVHVKNISHQTSEKEVRDFFSFCGKITNLSVTPESDAADAPKSATVTFEKETAAKTALLLDNTQLGSSQVSVSSAANIDDVAAAAGSSATKGDSDDIPQDEKPRARIFAEYLAHGYTLSDQAIERAIALDNKHGVSAKFTSSLADFDAKYNASDKAKGLDQSYGITQKAAAGWSGLHSYFEKAIGTPTGQKLVGFYKVGEKQVRDVHVEARRLADLKANKSDASGSAATQPASGTEKPSEGGSSATGPADAVAASTNVEPLGEKSEKVTYA